MTDILSIAAAAGTGITAGVYAGFSTIVMPALRRRPGGDAIRTMQAINVAAVRPGFMTIFFGTAVACAAVVIRDAVGHDDPGAPWRIAGGALSLASTAITIAYNVPLNTAIATLDPAADDSRWQRLDRRWTRGNTVRALAATLGLVAFLTSGGGSR